MYYYQLNLYPNNIVVRSNYYRFYFQAYRAKRIDEWIGSHTIKYNIQAAKEMISADVNVLRWKNNEFRNFSLLHTSAYQNEDSLLRCLLEDNKDLVIIY